MAKSVVAVFVSRFAASCVSQCQFLATLAILRRS
jgi:hypothetical protein